MPLTCDDVQLSPSSWDGGTAAVDDNDGSFSFCSDDAGLLVPFRLSLRCFWVMVNLCVCVCVCVLDIFVPFLCVCLCFGIFLLLLCASFPSSRS